MNDTTKYLNPAASYYQSYDLSLRDYIQKTGPEKPYVAPQFTIAIPFKKDSTIKVQEGKSTIYKW